MILGNTSSKVMLAAGTGIAVGVCSTFVIYRLTASLTSNVVVLMNKVDRLQNEIEQLRLTIDELRKKKKSGGYYSVHASSGEEEEDEFEEAVEGNDLDRLQNFNKSSSNQNVREVNQETGQSKDELFDMVDTLLEGGDKDKQKAYNVLHNNFNKFNQDADFLWRYAKTIYNVSLIEGAQGNAEAKKNLTFKALQTVSDALVIDDNNPNCHKWYAITLGSVGDYQSTQEKIQNGYKFKEHIEKAISLNPQDPSSHYLLGRWCYGVYMLSWVERKLAATLFASPPTSTVDDALEHFEKAQSLQTSQEWKENMLFIAKCNVEKSQYRQAAEWLYRANNVPTISQDDKTAQTEIDALLYKYGSYRQ